MGGEYKREGERVTSVTGFTLRLSSTFFKHPRDPGISRLRSRVLHPRFYDCLAITVLTPVVERTKLNMKVLKSFAIFCDSY